MTRALRASSDGELAAIASRHPHRHDAFAELVRRHLPRIVRLCQRFTSDEEEALDCAQEALVRAWLRAAQLEQPERFGAWLRAIAVRVCLDAQRDRAHPAPASPPAEASDPEQRVFVREVWAQLSDDERMIFALRADGASWREVADALGISVSAAKMRARRAAARAADRALG